jgi:hypothetical protein
VIEFDDRGVRPETSADLLAGDQAPLPFEQQHKDLEWLLRQADARTALTKFGHAHIQLKRPEPKSRRSTAAHQDF